MTTDADAYPQAHILNKKRLLWPWAIPLCTALFMIILLVQQSNDVGTQITVFFPDGHGIKVGDSLRHRGIVIGEIQTVSIDHRDHGKKQVQVDISLMPEADFLTHSHTRFWIVRPRLNLTSIHGADTIIGARYIAVSPGTGDNCHQFTGLSEEPAIIHRDPNGLEIICQARQRHGLQTGAPITYRQIIIGRVLSVQLASDASAIEARIYIDANYRELIRDNTVFWNASGFNISAGILSGLELNIESLEAVLHGGIAIAVPNNASDVVHNGHRFNLHDTSKDTWLNWNPSIDLHAHVHSSSNHAHSSIRSSDIPNIVEARLQWIEKGIFSNSERHTSAQIIAVNGGLIGPSSVLDHQAQSQHGPQLIIDTHQQELPELLWNSSGLAFLPLSLPRIPWLPTRMRIALNPEDADAVRSSEEHLQIAVSRLSIITPNNDSAPRWDFAGDSTIDPSWHGCPVLARSDHKLIGFLILEKKKAYVVPLNAELMGLIGK